MHVERSVPVLRDAPPRKISVKCKVCGRSGAVSLPPEFYVVSRGLKNLLVLPGVVCPHAFLAFVDSQFKVRGYQSVDCNVSVKSVGARPLLDRQEDFPPARPNSKVEQKHAQRVREVQGILRDFSNKVEGVRAVFVITHEGQFYGASEETYAVSGDLRDFVTTISDFALGVAHRLQLPDAPKVFEIQGDETRTLIYTTKYGYLALTHASSNQGLVLLATRKLMARVGTLLDGGA